MNATGTRRSTSFLSLLVITVCCIAAVWAGTHYADAAMVKPANGSHSVSQPASCRAMAQLPGGTQYVANLRSQHLTRSVLSASCTEGLEQYARSATPKAERTLELPPCSDTSGRYDSVCYTSDKANGTYLSLDYGRFFFTLKQLDMIGPNY